MVREKSKFYVKPFNDHGSGCSGHRNTLLDSTYENKEDRDLLITILDRLIKENETNT